jgi:hypothetical protein
MSALPPLLKGKRTSRGLLRDATRAPEGYCFEVGSPLSAARIITVCSPGAKRSAHQHRCRKDKGWEEEFHV